MTTTDYHAKLWATLLRMQSSDDRLGAISRSIANARVDLNPHQIDAALFALRSPLSKGVILADEVGLGKTIEAGLVLAQRWAERRRRLLIIVPASLRKQWQQELEDKFFLPGHVLEARAWNRCRAEGIANPFDHPDEGVVICSYHFAATHAAQIQRVPWDLIVVDEAHRLRNVYKPGSKTARAVAAATQSARKLLLTATPLQNSLLELYGLVSVIDEHVFGDLGSFREQFTRHATNEVLRDELLRERLKPICTRTLRKQVIEYIRYTERLPITQEFYPSDAEHQLYNDVSAYLQREMLAGVPSAQRMLMTMVLRKLLASSTFAIAGTLRRIIDRVEGRLADAEAAFDDFDLFDELSEEWEVEERDGVINPALIREELAALKAYADHAESIAHNAKGDALLRGLEIAFEKAQQLGAARKAVIFTESRRTQRYLFELLSTNGYDGRVVCMDGTNTDLRSREVYAAWRVRHRSADHPSGARAVDIKSAIIEEFRDRAEILIATEAGAEGINLQFCSLVVNYDLPWNPQRIEQRIGRCHRYGQQHDVVVVNFINKRNAADQRVYELLNEKFRLFWGVFGTSDEVLGAIESGVDIERRIAQVYQTCRTSEEIERAFDQLQADLQVQIDARLASTRQALLDNFDEEVHARLKFHHDEAQSALDQRQRWLLSLARHELAGAARFDADRPAFDYTEGALAPAGRYHLDWRAAERENATFFRPDHPLATAMIDRAASRDLPVAEITFDLDAYGATAAALEPLRGRRGWLEFARLTIESLAPEEFLLTAAVVEGDASLSGAHWTPLDADTAARLMNLPAAGPAEPLPAGRPESIPPDTLAMALEAEAAARRLEVERRHIAFVDEEVSKLDRWADDLKLGLEVEIREIDREIGEARAASRTAGLTLEQKLQCQRRVRDLERRRTQKRRDLFEAQDRIDRDRNALIEEIEARLGVIESRESVLRVRYSMV